MVLGALAALAASAAAAAPAAAAGGDIVFASNRAGEQGIELYVVGRDGSRLRRLTFNDMLGEAPTAEALASARDVRDDQWKAIRVAMLGGSPLAAADADDFGRGRDLGSLHQPAPPCAARSNPERVALEQDHRQRPCPERVGCTMWSLPKASFLPINGSASGEPVVSRGAELRIQGSVNGLVGTVAVSMCVRQGSGRVRFADDGDGQSDVHAGRRIG